MEYCHRLPILIYEHKKNNLDHICAYTGNGDILVDNHEEPCGKECGG